ACARAWVLPYELGGSVRNLRSSPFTPLSGRDLPRFPTRYPQPPDRWIKAKWHWVQDGYYRLCTAIGIYSRYAAGWMPATSENKELAERFLSSTIAKYEVGTGS
ncbi:hypothetical protein ACFVRE_43250, partial [Streptomyces sp. NPDC057910]